MPWTKRRFAIRSCQGSNTDLLVLPRGCVFGSESVALCDITQVDHSSALFLVPQSFLGQAQVSPCCSHGLRCLSIQEGLRHGLHVKPRHKPRPKCGGSCCCKPGIVLLMLLLDLIAAASILPGLEPCRTEAGVGRRVRQVHKPV